MPDPIPSRLAGACLAGMIAFFMPQSAAASDIATVKSRYIAEMTKAKIDPLALEKSLAAMKADGSFGDLDYADQQVNDAWQPRRHLERTKAFAAAYVSADATYARSATLKTAALKGLDYWLARDFKNKNWFWNDIGVPGLLAANLLVFYDDLSAAQKTKAMDIVGRAKIGQEGTNLVWLSQIVAQRGLLQNDPALVKQAFLRIANEINPVEKQTNGPQPDNSYLYHGPLLYTWGYGCYYLRENGRLAGLVAGTAFAFPKPKLAMIRDWTLDGFQWQARGPGADFGGEGRETGRKGQAAGILADIGEDLLNVDAGRADEVRAMIARTTSDTAATPLVGNKQFWRADLMVHHRPAYYASARLYSARTKNTEWGNGEALQNFYIADGANVLMKDGREYFDIFPVWDWQRIPGTTVELIPNFGPIQAKPDDAPGSFQPRRDTITVATKQTFVGGVSDGQYGASGGKFSRQTMALHKTFFFFDDQYVCLGAGLKCDTGNAVITTLDQTYLRGDVVTDAGPITPAATRPKWLLHDRVGYAFLTPASVQARAADQTGSWHDVSIAYPPAAETKPVFKAWIDHGASPKNAAYAYAVYPDTDAAKLAKAAAASPVTVVANTPAQQAVWHTGLKRGGAFAYDAGDIAFRAGLTVTVDRPCALLIAETPTGVSVTVADPENRPSTVRVTVTRDGKTSGADFDLPGGGEAGRSVTKKLTF